MKHIMHRSRNQKSRHSNK